MACHVRWPAVILTPALVQFFFPWNLRKSSIHRLYRTSDQVFYEFFALQVKNLIGSGHLDLEVAASGLLTDEKSEEGLDNTHTAIFLIFLLLTASNLCQICLKTANTLKRKKKWQRSGDIENRRFTVWDLLCKQYKIWNL